MGDRASGRVSVSFTSAIGTVEGVTRARFLRGALLAGGAVLLGGSPLLPSSPSSSPRARSPELDARILNFALLLEYIEFAFYQDALTRASLTGELREFAREVGRHERAHVRILQDSLGSAARSRPTFDFGDATSDPESFSTASLLLEETGLAAYIGQGANLSAAVAVTAGRITSVEARHTAWIRDILGKHPAPHAADAPMSKEEVSTVIRDTGFLP
jgi:rubrerythrin